MVPHQVTIIAYQADASGICICDIVETSRRYASKFARGIMRNPDMTHIAAIAPGQSLSDAVMREIIR